MTATLWLLLALLAAAPGFAQSTQPLRFPDLPLLTSGFVLDVEPLPDGTRVVAGAFSSVNGLALSNLAKLHQDGTLDQSWNPPALRDISAMTADAEGNVYVAYYATESLYRVLKLSAVDGSIVPGFAATSTQYVGHLQVHGGFLYATGSWRHPVSGIGMSIGRLSLAAGAPSPGWFTQAYGTSFGFDPQGRLYLAGGSLVRLLTDGSTDATWQPEYLGGTTAVLVGTDHVYASARPSSTFNPHPVYRVSSIDGAIDRDWGTTTDAPVHSMEFDATGTVWLGGEFKRVEGTRALGLARLGPEGALDRAALPDCRCTLRSIRRDYDGSLLLAGSLTRIDSFTRLGIARISATGEVLAEVGSVESAGNARAFARTSNGRILVGGMFSKVGQHSTSAIARFFANGALDTSWRSTVDITGYALAVDPGDGAVFVSGYHADVSPTGENFSKGLAKLHGSTGDTDGAWDVSGVNSASALHLDSDGWLYVGGTLGEIDGVPRLHLARVRAEAPGMVDPTWPSVTIGSVKSFASDEAGSLYVAFDGGATKLSRSTGQSIWRVNTSGSGVAVTDLLLSSGSIYLGGGFCNPAGSMHCYLARRSSATGVLDPTWSAATQHYVLSLALAPSGDLVAGRFILDGNGGGTPILEKIDAVSGAILPGWNPLPDGNVTALLVDAPNNRVWVGGAFSNISGVRRVGLAALPLVAPTEAIFGNDFEER